MAVAIESYRDLKIWQAGMALAAVIYEITRSWPKEELYGLTSQARRSAVSVPANIAEGYGRQSTRSYVHFLKMSRGSLKELETHLLLAEQVSVAPRGTCQTALQSADDLGRMMNAMIRRIDSGA